MARKKRMLHPAQEDQGAVYHCISRVVNRDFVLQREEKEQFVMLMRLYEEFCGVRVLTYCIMSNHFHLLIEVPPRPVLEEVSDTWIVEKLRLIYSESAVDEIRSWLMQYAAYAVEEGATEEIKTAYQQRREKYLYRMWDMREFMKVLKQRFTQWFNKNHKRRGALWEQRYKSVIVESGEAARVMAAYIDLNPVRAGMVTDPKGYRWCGYAEALAGAEPREGRGKLARIGICELMKRVDRDQRGDQIHQRDLHSYGWRSIAGRYRVMLFDEGRVKSDPVGQATSRTPKVEKGRKPKGKKRGFLAEEVEAEEQRGGKLSLTELLGHRIRYFSDGGIIGSRDFVNEVFEGRREWFGPNRREGAKRMRGWRGKGGIPKFYTAREVQ